MGSWRLACLPSRRSAQGPHSPAGGRGLAGVWSYRQAWSWASKDRGPEAGGVAGRKPGQGQHRCPGGQAQVENLPAGTPPAEEEVPPPPSAGGSRQHGGSQGQPSLFVVLILVGPPALGCAGSRLWFLVCPLALPSCLPSWSLAPSFTGTVSRLRGAWGAMDRSWSSLMVSGQETEGGQGHRRFPLVAEDTAHGSDNLAKIKRREEGRELGPGLAVLVYRPAEETRWPSLLVGQGGAPG